MGRWAGNGRCVLCSELFLDGPYGLRGSKKGMYYAKLFTFEKKPKFAENFRGKQNGPTPSVKSRPRPPFALGWDW